MIRGLYTAASGMNAELIRQDIIANNLANVSTAGFKKSDAVFEAFPVRLLKRIHDRMDAQNLAFALPSFYRPAAPLGTLGSGVKLSETKLHFSDGPMIRTDRPLDVALQGNGLFTVERGDGSLVYTRNGNFTLDAEKYLVTLGGDRVMGSNGRPIQIQGTDVVIDERGAIKVDGVDAGSLALVAYDSLRFERLGENMYVRRQDALEGIGEEPQADVRVLQGFSEQANVQVVEEMVRMIGVLRAYEANQKSVQMQDDSLNKLINEAGRV